MTSKNDHAGLEALCRSANAQAAGWGSPREAVRVARVRRPVLLLLACGLGLLAIAAVAAYVGSQSVQAMPAPEPVRAMPRDTAMPTPATASTLIAPVTALPSMRVLPDDAVPPPAAPASSSVSPEEAISQPDGSC